MISSGSREDEVAAARSFGRAPPRLSVVAPCYNEESLLPAFHERVTAACRGVVGEDYELVLVNDGSRDASWLLMSDLCQHDPRVVAVNLSRNHGHQLALSAGLSQCRGERILIIDADLQDPPELLGEMMVKMDEGYDVVYGKRSERRGESALKRGTAALIYRLLQGLADVPIPRDAGDFRLMSRRVLDILRSMPEHHRFIRGMVAWIGLPQAPLPYQRDPRHAGETKYTFSKMIAFALDAITGFSIRPLRAAIYIGFFTAICDLVLLFYVIASWMNDDVVPGWTSLMVVVLFLGSTQLMMVGILGEYVGRLYVEVKRRPLFVIDEIIRGGTPSPANSALGPPSHAPTRAV
ncbi:MAG: glycosyltransferase family 2 protein [Planctomycetes bacterium]|nr:glycosyltransferase family 2 protein [Planctomycetota bacterium]